MISRSYVQLPSVALSRATLGKLFTHMCLCHEAVYLWYRPMTGDTPQLGR